MSGGTAANQMHFPSWYNGPATLLVAVKHLLESFIYFLERPVRITRTRLVVYDALIDKYELDNNSKLEGWRRGWFLSPIFDSASEILHFLDKMTAHDQMRAMLDQLMGTGRNGTYDIFTLKPEYPSLRYYLQLPEISYKNTRWWRTPSPLHIHSLNDGPLLLIDIIVLLGENNKFQVKYSDPKVCKSFLLACCPHEILSSTVSLFRLQHIEYRWHTIGTFAL